MRIFTKKAFKFINRENGASVRTEPLSFHDVPDWVIKDPIFALALKDDSIEVIENKQRQKQLENDPVTKKAGRKKNIPAADGGEAADVPKPEAGQEDADEGTPNTERTDPDKV